MSPLQDVKSEVVLTAQVKCEPNDQQHGTESGFRPSLEEILTEKKLVRYIGETPQVYFFELNTFIYGNGHQLSELYV